MTLTGSRTEVSDVRDGRRFMHAIEYSLRWLEINAEAIDRLNVYPVPDGDTGTNMVLTLRAAVREATENPSDNVDVVAANLARGALLGARGNSGVILSQIIAGMARALEGHRESDAQTMARALTEAAEAAYGAVAQPVEGTMLTVAREVGRAAEQAAAEAPDVVTTLRHATPAAAEAVRNGPPEAVSQMRRTGSRRSARHW